MAQGAAVKTLALRLRCPKDAPREADRHLAVDVRLPLTIDALPSVMRAISEHLLRCPCGAELAIDARAEGV